VANISERFRTRTCQVQHSVKVSLVLKPDSGLGSYNADVS